MAAPKKPAPKQKNLKLKVKVLDKKTATHASSDSSTLLCMGNPAVCNI